jgi:hypothetical protein
MKRAMAVSLAFLLVMLLMACATAGRKVDVDAMRANIKLGETTKARVLQMCGEPESSEYDAKKETEILHYAYIEKNITGVGVVTHIAGVGDEWESRKTLVDVFVSKGIVIDMKTEDANSVKMHYK